MKTDNYKIPTDEIKWNPKKNLIARAERKRDGAFARFSTFYCVDSVTLEMRSWRTYICVMRSNSNPLCCIHMPGFESLQVCFLSPFTYSLNNKFQFAITGSVSTFHSFDTRFHGLSALEFYFQMCGIVFKGFTIVPRNFNNLHITL